ncbi:MAG: 3-deoxy-D-manno-octulosonate 8-phosphate phosphatase [Ignavibacteria bacterium]|nr:MAG: 3-deoxy-D-manno-octulosonate 8-phosphate phosphatase [Ignavibacteria bacterium]
MQHISFEEATRRARRIRLVLSDNDGVLTDTGVYYGPDGESVKRYSIRDGMGMERLGIIGIESGIITGERSPSLKRRAEKLKLKHLYLEARDKIAVVERIRREHHIGLDEIAYIGDDVNDLGIMDILAESGLTAAPADAMPQIAAIAHYNCAWRGGNGAFRDFAEAIITLRT